MRKRERERESKGRSNVKVFPVSPDENLRDFHLPRNSKSETYKSTSDLLPRALSVHSVKHLHPPNRWMLQIFFLQLSSAPFPLALFSHTLSFSSWIHYLSVYGIDFNCKGFANWCKVKSSRRAQKRGIKAENWIGLSTFVVFKRKKSKKNNLENVKEKVAKELRVASVSIVINDRMKMRAWSYESLSWN